MCPECIATAAQSIAGVIPAGALVTLVIAATRKRLTTRAIKNPSEEKMKNQAIDPETLAGRPVVSRAEWLSARKALLVAEKESTRQRDAVAAARRRLPMVEIDKEYVFDGPDGPVALRDLFGGRAQLIVYHFMFDPAWNEGCKSCSHFADNFAGSLVHLAARDTSFVVVSRAPIATIEAFKARMGWAFPWLSSGASDFNVDFAVTVDVDGAEGSSDYNYQRAATLFDAGKIWVRKGELPGLSVFLRQGERVFHTYSTYQRGLDLFLNTYNFLDLTPLGRQEEDGRFQVWIRHHDRYPHSAGNPWQV